MNDVYLDIPKPDGRLGGDFNTRETTPSGFLGGMPLAMLTGRGDQTLLKALGLKPIPDERVVLTDARDLDIDGKSRHVCMQLINTLTGN